jgi:hypothetical protein
VAKKAVKLRLIPEDRLEPLRGEAERRAAESENVNDIRRYLRDLQALDVLPDLSADAWHAVPCTGTDGAQSGLKNSAEDSANRVSF